MTKLFEPGNIGNLTLPNRIIRSATAERMADSEGRPTTSLKKLWVDLARGGTGLIITGHFYIHPSGKCHPEMTGIYDDFLIPELADLVDAVHKAGGKIAAQINHGGMQCTVDSVEGTIAPSTIDDDVLPQPAREMSVEEIQHLILAYAQAARRVKEAGFDAVQLHGAHGYLINQFISPFSNRRTDIWGGDLNGRIRFLKEVVHIVRCMVGEDYPVLIKFGMEDGVETGLKAEEGSEVIGLMKGMGIDGIEISGGIRANNTMKGIKSEDREAYFLPLAKIAKKTTDLPIILVGGMRSKIVMEHVLSRGVVDFVSMCRPLINDPNLPKQLKEGVIGKSGCISSNNCWPTKNGEGISCKCPVI